jgi:hypothetical protein
MTLVSLQNDRFQNATANKQKSEQNDFVRFFEYFVK